MELNDLKKKAQTSKTAKFIEQHKEEIITYGLCTIGGFVLGKYVKHLFDQKSLCELKMRSISYNTAAVRVSGEENAAKIYETARAIEQSMRKEFGGLRYKDISKLLDNRGTDLPNVK